MFTFSLQFFVPKTSHVLENENKWYHMLLIEFEFSYKILYLKL